MPAAPASAGGRAAGLGMVGKGCARQRRRTRQLVLVAAGEDDDPILLEGDLLTALRHLSDRATEEDASHHGHAGVVPQRDVAARPQEVGEQQGAEGDAAVLDREDDTHGCAGPHQGRRVMLGCDAVGLDRGARTGEAWHAVQPVADMGSNQRVRQVRHEAVRGDSEQGVRPYVDEQECRRKLPRAVALRASASSSSPSPACAPGRQIAPMLTARAHCRMPIECCWALRCPCGVVEPPCHSSKWRNGGADRPFSPPWSCALPP